ncbi:MAG: WXG100 family type VII secretion target, partial [Mycobacterium sp.]
AILRPKLPSVTACGSAKARLAMADELRVNPEALCHAGNEIANHGETLHAVQQCCHGEVQDAHPGWVGSSGRALSRLLDNWATTSTAHIKAIGGQSCKMHFAAAEFTSMEQRNAAALGGH